MKSIFDKQNVIYVDGAFSHEENGYPTDCVRCKILSSAQGYYEAGKSKFDGSFCKIGICKKHKRHAISKIIWY